MTKANNKMTKPYTKVKRTIENITIKTNSDY